MEILIAFLGAVLIYFIQITLYSNFWDRGLSMSFHFSTTQTIEGDELLLTQQITNKKFLPLPALRVKFQTSKFLIFKDTSARDISDLYYRNDLFSLNIYQKVTQEFVIKCLKRGYYQINQCDLICSDLFFRNIFVKNEPINLSLYVYPRYISDIYLLATFQKIHGDIISKRFLHPDPFEFASIRQYQPFDTLKSVNWNASARSGELKVNVNATTFSQQVKIILNLEVQSIA